MQNRLRFGSTCGRALVTAAVAFLSASCGEATKPVLPPGDPVDVVAVAGDGQRAEAGTTFEPLAALVTDANGTPVPGVPVAFGIPGPYMSFFTIDVITTASDGIARLVGQGVYAAGDRSITARIPNGRAVAFKLTSLPGPPARIEMGPYSVIGRQTGSEWTASATVYDRGGSTLAGRAVTFSVAGPSGATVTPSVATTNATGVATVRWTLGPTLGTYTLTAVIDTARRTITLAAVSGPPAAITRASPDSVRVILQGVTAPAVLVFDAAGLPVPGATVRWTSPPGTLVSCDFPDPQQSVTDSVGIARCRLWRLDQVGPSTISASVGAASVGFSAVALPVPASVTFVSAPDTLQEIHTDTELPSELVAEVRMSDGTPAMGYPVRFVPQGGSVSPAIVTTDSSGRARTRWRTTLSPGRTTLVAELDVGSATSQRSDTTSVRAYGPLPLLPFAGRSHTCGIGQAGLYCWGSNSVQQSGDALGGPDRLLPTRLTGVLHATEYWALGDHTCYRDYQSDGHLTGTTLVSCWGLGPDGVRTYGTPTAVPVTAYQHPGLSRANVDAPVVVRADGALHACVTTSLGSIFCAGRNDHGQLGDGTTVDRDSATKVPGLTFASLIETGPISAALLPPVLGESHTCGRTTAGAWMCWGRNDAGQLGDGTTVDRPNPVAISSGLAFTRLTAGVAHTCGITAEGTAYCWGSNASGQLGTGTMGGNAATPQRVAGDRAFVYITAGDHHTCARVANGLTYCWGRNDHGQLGDGTRTDRSVPTSLADLRP
jgi:hypothetical protein